MSVWAANTDLADFIAENLLKGREDARPVSRALANQLELLIREVLAEGRRDE